MNIDHTEGIFGKAVPSVRPELKHLKSTVNFDNTLQLADRETVERRFDKMTWLAAESPRSAEAQRGGRMVVPYDI